MKTKGCKFCGGTAPKCGHGPRTIKPVLERPCGIKHYSRLGICYTADVSGSRCFADADSFLEFTSAAWWLNVGPE